MSDLPPLPPSFPPSLPPSPHTDQRLPRHQRPFAQSSNVFLFPANA
jgi:hypothetical protein